ncbi:MAG TPA: KpsF/GutQ family sugar-phosphate isomerase [Chlamydiales bacterium]|nr:KpsF/GutQ family sugar-phosphate isomerase [Chlamydiales bacterium]
MLKTLFDEQRQYLNHFFDAVDLAAAEKVFEKLLHCKGVVVLSGVGKSGHIAQKISTTFLSTGTRSFFLSPANALHGDIGFISPQDIFLCFSKSGESQELLELLPHIQKKGAATVAIVSQLHSRLAKNCDLSIFLPVERELCPYDLAPTTSTAVQLIFGDSLAIALMRAKQFTLADFAANHPAGLLGRKITLKVTDLMLKGESIPLCKPSDKLIDVLHELSLKRCGCLLVIDDKKQLLGIFTDGDLRRAVQTNGGGALQSTLSTLMTPAPRTISPQQLAFDAMKRMEEDPTRLITVLPVVQEGKVIGLLRMHDILQSGLSH